MGAFQPEVSLSQTAPSPQSSFAPPWPSGQVCQGQESFKYGMGCVSLLLISHHIHRIVKHKQLSLNMCSLELCNILCTNTNEIIIVIILMLIYIYIFHCLELLHIYTVFGLFFDWFKCDCVFCITDQFNVRQYFLRDRPLRYGGWIRQKNVIWLSWKLWYFRNNKHVI